MNEGLSIADCQLPIGQLARGPRQIGNRQLAIGRGREVLQDLHYGIRMLLKYPGFSAIVVITLALGIGANTAIFSVTDKLLLRSLPVNEPEQLVLITSVSVSPHFV